jgi:excisionase family DNA binding protein
MGVKLRERTVLPPDDPSDLTRFARGLSDASGAARLIGPDGSEIAIPPEMYGLLRSVVDALAQGMAISIVPHNTELTTQEAADLLSISRPTLVRLLTEGEIPYSMRGRHRRVLLRDLLDYTDRTRVERRRALDDIAAEGEEMDLYNVTATPEETR